MRKPYVEDVGDADPAMHLHGLVERPFTQVGGARLGEARERSRAVRPGVGGLQRGGEAAAQQLDLDVQARGAVLQRLEGPDRHVELHPLLEVAHRAPERLGDHAQQFGGDTCPRPVEHAVQRVERQVGCADERRVVELHAREADTRRVAAVDQPRALDLDAGRRRVHEEQAESVAMSRCIGAARHDDQPVGHVTVQHELLLPVQPPVTSLPPGAQRHLGRVVTWRLVDGEREQRLARADLWQPEVALRRTAGLREQSTGQHHRGEQRRGRQRAAHLLENSAEALVADPEAAKLRGQYRGRPAEIGHLTPDLRVVAALVATVTQGAQRRDGRPSRQELLRAVAQHALLIVQQERHRHLKPAARARVGR